jgi:hypothetical protein
MCGVSQPSEHFECTLQDCGNWHKLQSAAWGAPHFPPKEKASEGTAGLDLILQAELLHLTKKTPRALRLFLLLCLPPSFEHVVFSEQAWCFWHKPATLNMYECRHPKATDRIV